MDRSTLLYTFAGLGLTGTALAAWVAYRLYVRQATLEELLRSRFVAGGETARTFLEAGLGLKLNLPTAPELAVSLVPIFDINSPYDAIDDILIRGRESPYWPEKYRQGGSLGVYEPILLDALSRLRNIELQRVANATAS